MRIKALILQEHSELPLLIPILFAAGIALFFALKQLYPYSYPIMGLIIGILLGLIYYRNKLLRLFCLGFIIIISGFLYMQLRVLSLNTPPLTKNVSQVRFSGIISKIEHNPKSTHIWVVQLSGLFPHHKVKLFLPKSYQTILQTSHQSSVLDTIEITEASAITSSLRASASEVRQSSFDSGLLRTSGARNDEVIAETSVIPTVSNTPDWWKTRHDEVIEKVRNDGGASRVLPLQAGQEITGVANFFPIPPPLVPRGYDLQRQMYFEDIHAFGTITHIDTTKSRAPSYNLPFYINYIRALLQQTINTHLSKNPAAMAEALILGNKQHISDEILLNIKKAGLMHLLAISGLHMGMVAGFFYLIFRYMFLLIPRFDGSFSIQKWAMCISMLGCFVYYLCSNQSIPTLRALIMVMLICMGILLNRQAISLRILAIAAFIVLIIQPEVVISPGFQLSFMAVMTLIAGFRHQQKHQKIEARWLFWLKNCFYSSLVATLATTPIIMYHFHQFGFYGLISNFIAIPLTGIVILPALIMGFVFSPLHLAWPFFKIADLALHFMIWFSEMIAHLPYAWFTFPLLNPYAFACFLLGLSLFCVFKTSLRHTGSLVLILAFFLALFSQTPDYVYTHQHKSLLAKQNAASYIPLTKGRDYYLLEKHWPWLVDEAHVLEMPTLNPHNQRAMFIYKSKQGYLYQDDRTFRGYFPWVH